MPPCFLLAMGLNEFHEGQYSLQITSMERVMVGQERENTLTAGWPDRPQPIIDHAGSTRHQPSSSLGLVTSDKKSHLFEVA